ncbi:Proteasome subunit beta type-4 [Drechslerella dactyloides]|uniref:Proteasome subunit beta n=1 Tax=Drechslerella dactyloides TaxID=74499 RepID=A0AAD6IWE5_DREDA|nr:Proteasome subunit beta type-4 [Drechslerella dactyloides]
MDAPATAAPPHGDVLLGIRGKDFVLIGTSKAFLHGITVMKATDDKTRTLNDHTLLAFSGESGDTIQFAEFIQANTQLYTMRHSSDLPVASVASFVRSELASSLRSRHPYTVNMLIGGYEPKTETPMLYWLDYLASAAEIPYAAHGYAQYYCLSILDAHYKKGMSVEEVTGLMRDCHEELRRRMPIDFKGLRVKIVDKDGVREVEGFD